MKSEENENDKKKNENKQKTKSSNMSKFFGLTHSTVTGTNRGSSSTFHRSGFVASLRKSWCTSTTDHGEKVEVIQLVRVIVVPGRDAAPHTAPRGQMTTRAEEEDQNCTETVQTHPLPQAASTVYYTFGDNEEVLAAGVRPAPLSEVAGPQERVQRHIVELIEELVPMVRVRVQVIVPPLPEVQFVERVARVRAPLVPVPASAVPPTGLRDPTDAALDFEEEEEEEEDEGVEEEEEVEMFDEHSSFRHRRLCRHYMSGRCEEGWSCSFAHGPFYSSWSRTWTRQYHRSRLSSWTSRSSWWMCQCHRPWEYRGRCEDHTTGAHAGENF